MKPAQIKKAYDASLYWREKVEHEDLKRLEKEQWYLLEYVFNQFVLVDPVAIIQDQLFRICRRTTHKERKTLIRLSNRIRGWVIAKESGFKFCPTEKWRTYYDGWCHGDKH